ncbi:PepSY domain-containing protein [Trichothermofontia sichuanensis B231]|uniref:PepSY domain-containing protein n=1 Tax=Trichothermofontia sichuanensis TaxID=3045816 RepID=UPI0022460166|nr:PepSY domain-containing protein [Trichothermofontia sichuanensis]UZQ52966.1 PepSY domain-containing protein [Trichothermofontia sichuanensis B231]
MDLRKIHRKIAPILFIPLLLTAFTGVAYRIGRSWFGLSKEFGNFMMLLHEGRFLGQSLVPFYVLLLGLGLLGMIVSGIALIKQRKKAATSKTLKLNERTLHRVIAPIAFLPFTISAITGISYRLGKAWFGLSGDQVDFLLKIHQGSYLGSTFRPIYVLLVGVSLIAMLLTGIQMSGIVRKRRSLTLDNS